MATAVLALLPPVLVVALMQRWFVAGLTAGEEEAAGCLVGPRGGRVRRIRRQNISDPCHECADLARQIAPMCHDEGHGERPATRIRYDLHKRATLQVSADPQEW